MSLIPDALHRWAEIAPGKLVMQDDRVSLIYAAAALKLDRLSAVLTQQDIKVVALLNFGCFKSKSVKLPFFIKCL